MNKRYTIISFLQVIIQIVLIGLKLLNVISWSWWIVFIPFEIFSGLFLLAIIVISFAITFLEK